MGTSRTRPPFTVSANAWHRVCRANNDLLNTISAHLPALEAERLAVVVGDFRRLIEKHGSRDFSRAWTPNEPAASQLGRSQAEPSGWWEVADAETVWRVCHALEGKCKRCPATEEFRGNEGCTRGCYMQAVECVNIVQTGNPWRKTSGVKPPWVAMFPAESPRPQSEAKPSAQVGALDEPALLERLRKAEGALERIDALLNVTREQFVLQGPAFVVKRVEQVRKLAREALSTPDQPLIPERELRGGEG